jgi:hypothetical protein
MSILKIQRRTAMRCSVRQGCGLRGAGLCFGGEIFRFRPVTTANTLDRYTSQR